MGRLLPVVALLVALGLPRPLRADNQCGVNSCGANTFTCNVSAFKAISNCQGAPGAGLSLYVEDFGFSVSIAEEGEALVTGTSVACGSNQTLVTPFLTLGTNSNLWMDLRGPAVKLPANQALCCKPLGTSGGQAVISCYVTGFIAP